MQNVDRLGRLADEGEGPLGVGPTARLTTTPQPSFQFQSAGWSRKYPHNEDFQWTHRKPSSRLVFPDVGSCFQEPRLADHWTRGGWAGGALSKMLNGMHAHNYTPLVSRVKPRRAPRRVLSWS
jgi:hypothetical protein